MKALTEEDLRTLPLSLYLIAVVVNRSIPVSVFVEIFDDLGTSIRPVTTDELYECLMVLHVYSVNKAVERTVPRFKNAIKNQIQASIVLAMYNILG
jgi:hypothetical protein